MTKTAPLGLTVGDWIVWKDDEVCLSSPAGENTLIAPGMVGKVVSVGKVSESAPGRGHW